MTIAELPASVRPERRGGAAVPPRTPAAESTATTWRFGEFTLDAPRYELRRSGRAVPVEPQVIEVLAYLVTHHARVVGRDELRRAIWGPDNGSEASLSTRIKAARRALGDSGDSQAFIRTVRGRGYQFLLTPEKSGTAPAPPQPRPEARAQHIAFARAHDGVRLAYAAAGSGAPLVRAGNWTTHLGCDTDSPLWRHWNIELARHRRLIRYDERGCGLSDRDVGEFTFDDWVADLEAVVDAAGVDRFPLLGVSRGGTVAIAYAARHPERVSQLILVNAATRGRTARAVGDVEHRLAAVDLELARLGWEYSDLTLRQVFAAQTQPSGSRLEWDAFDSSLRCATSPANAVRFLEESARIDVLAEARTVTCPTLVVHAVGDRRVPYACGQELASVIKDARLVTLASDNHALTADEPAWRHLVHEVDAFLGD